MIGSGLRYGVVADIFLLVLVSQCHCVFECDPRVVVEENPVALPEDDVSEAEWLRATVAAGNFQVLAAVHREDVSW